MQRDVYAALIKKKHKKMIPVNILQLSGNITRENLFDEVFQGYKLRRIILMTNMAGQTPSAPWKGGDIIINNFEKLMSIHQPHYQYKLLPLLCADFEAFAALQGICSSPSSPFVITDRRDPQTLTYRFSFGCGGREKISDFFKDHIPASEMELPVNTRKLPIAGVQFDGMLVKLAKCLASPIPTAGDAAGGATEAASAPPQSALVSSAALVTTHDTLSERAILQRALMRDFFESPLYWTLSGATEASHEVKRVRDRFHFMAIKRLVGTDAASRKHLLRLSGEKKLFVYEKVADDVYTYAT